MIKKPVGVALKVCEKAVIEKNTGNVTLVNCLRRLRINKRFPAKAPSLFAFVTVTDALGSCEMEMVVNQLATMDKLASRKWDKEFSEPLREQWFLVPLGPFEIPSAGRYEVALMA